MENDRKTPAPAQPPIPIGALVASSLWLQLGFVGASALVIALMRLFDRGASPAVALAGAVGAGALTALAWRRSRAVLADLDASAPPGTAAARRAAFGQDLESAVSR